MVACVKKCISDNIFVFDTITGNNYYFVSTIKVLIVLCVCLCCVIVLSNTANGGLSVLIVF